MKPAEKLLGHGSFWQIHGARYDLTDFVSRHPGGETAVLLGRGRDCTRLFETYHVWGDAHRRVLASHAVERTDAASGGEEAALPRDGPFATDLKAMLRKHFRVEQGNYRRLSHHATWGHLALHSIGMAISFASGCLYCTGCSTLAGGVWPLSAWIFGASVGHDCSHRAFSRRPWVNDLGLLAASPLYFSPSTWMAQHVVGHHTHTNNPALDGTGDPDLHHTFLPVGFSPLFKHRKLQRTHRADASFEGVEDKAVHFASFVISCFGATFHLCFLQPIAAFFGIVALGPHVHRIGLVTGIRRMVLLNAAHVALALLCVSSCFHSWGGSFQDFRSLARGLACAALPWLQSSVYFMVVTQVSHLQPDAQRAEIAVHDVQSQDTFLRGQVATSTDYSTSSYFWHILTTGLNAQSLHHSLPGICSCHFTQLYPAFEAICRKHKVEISRREHLGHALLTMSQYQFELGVESSK